MAEIEHLPEPRTPPLPAPGPSRRALVVAAAREHALPALRRAGPTLVPLALLALSGRRLAAARQLAAALPAPSTGRELVLARPSVPPARPRTDLLVEVLEYRRTLLRLRVDEGSERR